MAVMYSPKIVTDGLILMLDAANSRSYPGSGTAWKDLSGNGNNGTLTNGPSFDSGNGGSLVFDGTDDRTITSTNISFGDNATWIAWVNRTTAINGINMFMGRYLPYFAARSGETGFHFSNRIGVTQQNVFTTGITVQNNTWYSVSFTTEYDGSDTTMKIYVNGDFNNSGTFSGSQGEYSQGFAIGEGRDYAAWYPFNGKVSNVKIYNRTLSPQEIQQNYNATKSRYNL